MENSGLELHRRSDGLVETPDAQFAVVMKALTGITRDGIRVFNFKTHMQGDQVSVQWDREDNIALFPEEIARPLLAQGYARTPDDAEVALLGGVAVAQEVGTPAPAPTPAVAPAPTPSEPPSAPVVPPAPSTDDAEDE